VLLQTLHRPAVDVKKLKLNPKKTVKWNPYLGIEEDSQEKSQFKVKAARRRKTVDPAPAKSETYDSGGDGTKRDPGNRSSSCPGVR